MMKEEVIVLKLPITRIGEKKFFQVRLPKDSKRIIGLEYSARKIYGEVGINERVGLLEGFADDIYFRRNSNKVIGQLSLQNSGCACLFYQGDLVEDRNNQQHEKIAALQYTICDWVQSTKREEIGFCVKGDMIEGMFKDEYGENEYVFLEYELSIYFWIEKCAS